MTNEHKARAINKRAILARYDGKCPYPHCQSQGEIRAYQDYIVNGPLGWGHAECVNAKIHFSIGHGISLCKTTQIQRMVHDEKDWDSVTCKKCLKARAKIQDLKDEYVIADTLRIKASKIAALIGRVVVNEDFVTHWTAKLAENLSELSDAQLIKYGKLEFEIDAFVSEVKAMTDDELAEKKKEVKSDRSSYNPIKQALSTVHYVAVDSEKNRRYFKAHPIKR